MLRPTVPTTIALLGAVLRVPGVAAQAGNPPQPLTLAEAVQLALDHDPGLASARARAAGSTARVRETAGSRWPQLTFQGTAMQFQEPMIVAPLHRFDIERRPQFDDLLLQTNLSLGFTLFDGGVRGARVRGARAEADGAEALTASTEADLLTDVTRRYLSVLTGAGVHQAHQAGVAALQAESLRVAQFFSEGRAARVQLLQVAAALAEARAAAIGAAHELDAAERSLARALGIPITRARADRLRALRLTAGAAPPPRDRLHAAADNNPQLEVARARVDAARWQRRAAVGTWIPQVDLIGSYLGFGSAGGEFQPEWQAGIRLSYPLFTGGSRPGTVARWAAQADAAEQQLRVTKQEIDDAVDRTLGVLAAVVARVEAGTAATEHFAEVARIERLRVEAGAATEADYLRAEADLRRSRAALVEARHELIGVRVELALLTGALSPAWLAAALENAP